MSTTMINLTPVFVSHPYVASRSSIACSNPRSWSIDLLFWRISKMSRQEFIRNEKSSIESKCGGKSAMCRGLSFQLGQFDAAQ